MAKKVTRRTKHIGLVKNDIYLEPFEDAIRGRHDHAVWKINQLTNNGKQTLNDFANGYALLAISTTGSRKRNIVQRELKAPVNGN